MDSLNFMSQSDIDNQYFMNQVYNQTIYDDTDAGDFGTSFTSGIDTYFNNTVDQRDSIDTLIEKVLKGSSPTKKSSLQNTKRKELRKKLTHKLGKFKLKLSPLVLKCTTEVLEKEYPTLYVKSAYYEKLAYSLLFALEEYSSYQRINTETLTKIKPIKDVFEKDRANNYSVGHHNQGYKVTEELSDIVNSITTQMTLNKNHFDVINTSYECFTISQEEFSKASSEIKAILLPQIAGVTEQQDYFFFNHKDYQTEGRTYSTFSALNQTVKKMTDTPYEIDISSAVQSLMLSILTFSPQYKSKFSHQSYGNVCDVYPNVMSYVCRKQHHRDTTQNYTGKDMKWVKQLYTVPCFGGNHKLIEFYKIAKERDIHFQHCDFVKQYTSQILKLRNELFELILASDTNGYSNSNPLAVIPQEAMSYVYNKVSLKRAEYHNKGINWTENGFKTKAVYYLVEY